MASGDDLAPGDGSEIVPATGFESLWRMQFGADVDGHRYTLEADVLGWAEECFLYRDGVQVAAATSPATFALAELASTPKHAAGAAGREHLSDARIEARIGWFGMRWAHVVTAEGEREMTPLKGSWEYRRAKLSAKHPVLAVIGLIVAAVLLIAALFLEVTQSVQWVTRADWFDAVSAWEYTAPVDLPLAANIGITLVGILAAAYCAINLRHRWLYSD